MPENDREDEQRKRRDQLICGPKHGPHSLPRPDGEVEGESDDDGGRDEAIAKDADAETLPEKLLPDVARNTRG